MVEPEHGHAHAHKTGLPWLDVVVAVSVVCISVMSLVVSILHGLTMEKLVHENERMVAADTLPYLMVYKNGYDVQSGRRRVSYELKNAGVGPAVIDWFELRWRGKAYDTPDDLIRACCATPGAAKPNIAFGNVSGSVLPAKEIRELLVDMDEGPDADAALDRATNEMSARACYCSVLDECWVTISRRAGPSRSRTAAFRPA